MEYEIEYIDGCMLRYPKVLYKYRDWNNPFHRNVLTDSALYFASPKDFEDIKDCNVPEKFPQKNELYEYFINKAKNEYPLWSRQQRRIYARKWAVKSPLADPVRLKEHIKLLNTEFNERFGVLSMTSNPNNDEMWIKYANDHSGVCYGFNSKILFSCFCGGGGEVQYVKELPVIDFAEDDFEEKHIKNIFFKEDKWSFENEYRLHKMWNSKPTVNERNIKFPNDCLEEVHLGKLISENDKEHILNIEKFKFPKAKIIED